MNGGASSGKSTWSSLSRARRFSGSLQLVLLSCSICSWGAAVMREDQSQQADLLTRRWSQPAAAGLPGAVLCFYLLPVLHPRARKAGKQPSCHVRHPYRRAKQSDQGLYT